MRRTRIVIGPTAVALATILGVTSWAAEVKHGSAATRKPQTLEVPNALQIDPAAPSISEVAQLPPIPGAADAAGEAKGENISERYPNGNLKLERHVIQDANGNYVNHGPYVMYDVDGNVIRKGEFRNGKQQGKWTQTFVKDEGSLFSGIQDSGTLGPFLSEADFVDGQLHGVWTIRAKSGKNILEWTFEAGAANGKWTWWHANGQKRLEAFFKDGALHGDVTEWTPDGKQASQKTYIEGRYLAKSVGWYALGQKSYEGYYLRVQNMPEVHYDWWTTTAGAPGATPEGGDLKHGQWTAWYRNGNKKTEGQYDHDVPVGKFVWWYENGQKQAEGEFANGLRSNVWTTWHANGLKESEGLFKDGTAVGKWTRWEADGKLAEVHDMNTARPVAANTQSNPNQRPTTNQRTSRSPMENTRSR